MAPFARGCNILAETIRKYLKKMLLGIENAVAISMYTGKSQSCFIIGVEDKNTSAAPSSHSECVTEKLRSGGTVS